MSLRLVLLAAAVGLGCRDSVAPEVLGTRIDVWIPESIAILRQSSSCCFGPAFLVVSDSAHWREVWRDASDVIPAPPAPAVEFSTDVVIVAAAAGTPGLTLSLDSVVRFELGRRAYLTVGGCPIPIQVVALPHIMVRAPAMSVVERRVRDRLTCPQ